MKYSHLVRFFNQRPWAIHEDAFHVIQDVLTLRLEGVRFDADEIQTRVAATDRGPRKGAVRGDAVAIIPIYGTIAQRAGMTAQSSGGTSVEGIRADFRDALADPSVAAIVLEIDSPGGTVDGIPELAAEFRAARTVKPIYAIANVTAASAALWLASGAERVSVSPSGWVGSIGVIAGHVDTTAAREAEGIKRTLIAEPARKADGWGGDPISEDGLGEIRSQVGDLYRMFVGDMAKGRGVTMDHVRERFGGGSMLMPAQALEAGLVDAVETLDETVRLAAREATRRASAARAGAGARLALIDDDDDVTGEPDEVDPGVIVVTPIPAGSEASLPFGDHLRAVAGAVEVITDRTRKRAAFRARDGRGLSPGDRDELRRVLALRPFLDEIEATLAQDDAPRVPATPLAEPSARVRVNNGHARLRELELTQGVLT